MKKQTLAIFLVLTAVGFFTVSAAAQATHSVWTNGNGLIIIDPGLSCSYATFSSFDTATSWTEPTPVYSARAHFRGVAEASAAGCPNSQYDFQLVKAGTTDPDYITGSWDVYRNGVQVCTACDGIAYNLSATVGNYYKVYIDDPTYGSAAWLFSGYIDTRKDF